MKKTIDISSKKRGRPLASEKEKRSERIEIRLTKEEKIKLKKLHKKSVYRSTSDMLREIILEEKYKIVDVDPENNTKKMMLISEAKAIGINFNQVVKLLNSKNTTYFSKNEKEKLIKQVDLIQQILLKIHKEFF